jgi:hypothetical protein
MVYLGELRDDVSNPLAISAALGDFAISGMEFDERDLETLILAGRLAEKTDRQDASNPS